MFSESLSSCQNQTMASAGPGRPDTGELELSGSPGILSQSEGFLSKFGPISTKNWDNTPTYLLDTAAHRKHGLEIIWLYKKSPSPMSGPDTDTGTTFEINLPDVAFWASFYVHAMIAAAFNSLTEIKPWLDSETSQTDRMRSARPHPGQASRAAQCRNIMIFLRHLWTVFLLLV